MNHEQRLAAIFSLKPNGKFHLKGENLIWKGSDTAPTESEIQAEHTRFESS